MKFLKLTEYHSGEPIWVHMEMVTHISKDKYLKSTLLRIPGIDNFNIRETPEEIMKLLGAKK